MLEKTYISLTRKFPTAPLEHITPIQLSLQGSPLLQLISWSTGSIRLLFTASNALTADI